MYLHVYKLLLLLNKYRNPTVLFQILSFYNTNNKSEKFDKTLTHCIGWPGDSIVEADRH